MSAFCNVADLSRSSNLAKLKLQNSCPVLQVVNFFQDPPRLAPPYSIARLAGIETEEKLEEKEVKEGGGEERVDSSESDEPKVKITRERSWH